MTPATESLSLQEKVKILMNPPDPKFPIDIAFITDQIEMMHGELQGRLYKYLSPKCAEISLKLIYALPIAVLLRSLSSPQSAVISLLSSGFLLTCKEEIISKEAKINLLHSIAIGFFANLLSVPVDLSQGSALRIMTSSGLLALTILAANSIEDVEEAQQEEIETVDADAVDVVDAVTVDVVDAIEAAAEEAVEKVTVVAAET